MNKEDAVIFKRASDDIERRPPGLVFAGFDVADGHDADPRHSGEIFLTPIQKSTGGTTLGGGDC
jgi:hypothetical protein